MGEIGREHLCKGCMSYLQYTDRPCPKCGFDEKWFYSGKEYLKVSSVLDDKYLVGKTIEQNDYEIIYIGWDLDNDERVIIRECYLKDVVNRDSTVSNEVVVSDKKQQPYFSTYISKYEQNILKIKELGELFSITKTHDVVRANGTVYSVTDYIESITLDEYIEKQIGKISVYEILMLLQPIMYSLITIHNNGLVHGDINLDNIVISSSGDVYLKEFGIYSNLRQKTYLDDIKGICKIVYKILCGARYSNNIICFKETGRLSMPSDVKGYISDMLNRGMSKPGSKNYFGMVEMYNDIYGNEEYQKDIQNTELLNYSNNQQDMTSAINQAGNPRDMINAGYNKDVRFVSKKGIKGFEKAILITVVAATIIVVLVCYQIINGGDKKGQINNPMASEGDAIEWKDESFESAIRKQLDYDDSEVIYPNDVKDITTLTISTKNVKSIEDVKHFPNLKTLIANNNRISDISFLKYTPNIEEINLSENDINDISCLAELKKLKKVYLDSNAAISDITCFSEMSELQELDLSSNGITDISALSSLTKLKILSLAYNQITELDALADMTKLERLDLAYNPNIEESEWEVLNQIKRVNGRPYKLRVQFCYQRDDKQYEKWQLYTWRSDPAKKEKYMSKTDIHHFSALDPNSSAPDTQVMLAYEMCTDQFGFAIQRRDDPSVREYEADRFVEISETLGEVKIKVVVFQGMKKVYTVDWVE